MSVEQGLDQGQFTHSNTGGQFWVADLLHLICHSMNTVSSAPVDKFENRRQPSVTHVQTSMNKLYLY